MKIERRDWPAPLEMNSVHSKPHTHTPHINSYLPKAKSGRSQFLAQLGSRLPAIGGFNGKMRCEKLLVGKKIIFFLAIVFFLATSPKIQLVIEVLKCIF